MMEDEKAFVIQLSDGRVLVQRSAIDAVVISQDDSHIKLRSGDDISVAAHQAEMILTELLGRAIYV